MSKIISFLFMTTLICFHARGQQTLFGLTANSIEAKENLTAIYNLDVFKYFNLTEYDTDLKKSVFKKTQEFQDLLTELKSKRVEMLKTSFYTFKDEKFKDVNYDMKRKGFSIEIGANFGLGTASARAPKSIYLTYGERVILKSLPSKQVPEPIFGPGIYTDRLFLAMSEETGLEIENDKDNVQIYFFFTPTGKEKTTFKFYNNTSNSYGGWYTITQNILKSDNVRIVVANKLSGVIYFDKNYIVPAKTTATKK